MSQLVPFETVTSRREHNSRQEVQQLRESYGLVSERLAELELAIEDRNWQKLTAESNREFSRQGLRIIAGMSRLFFLKNPLTKRAVSVKATYVWGQGVNINAEDDKVNDVLQSFMDQYDNRKELFGHQSRVNKEVDLEVNGNIFFVLFPNKSTGEVKISTIPFDEVEDIKTDPQNRKSPRYYVRKYTSMELNEKTGSDEPVAKTEYYPDWHYFPKVRPETMGGSPVHWDSPVYHIKVGGLDDMRFGVPETYAGLDWVRSYKEFLEDWATLTRAHSRVAWKIATKQGQAGIAAAKAKLNTTVATGGTSFETNPPQVTGSSFISTGDTMEPMKTAGAHVSMEDGRRLGMMAGSAHGIPETMLFGDVSKGAHATAKTLDRPTELMMKERQGMWIDVLKDIFDYVIDWAIVAPKGKLHRLSNVKYITGDDVVDGAELLGPKSDQMLDRHIDVDFPPVLQQELKDAIGAVVSAVTLDGNAPNGAFPDKRYVAGMFLKLLGEDDVDELLDKWFPEGMDTTWPVVAAPVAATGSLPPEEAAFKEALESFIDKLGKAA